MLLCVLIDPASGQGATEIMTIGNHDDRKSYDDVLEHAFADLGPRLAIVADAQQR
jgi:hypothetical protein